MITVDFFRRLPALVIVGPSRTVAHQLEERVRSIMGDKLPRTRVVVALTGADAGKAGGKTHLPFLANADDIASAIIKKMYPERNPASAKAKAKYHRLVEAGDYSGASRTMKHIHAGVKGSAKRNPENPKWVSRAWNWATTPAEPVYLVHPAGQPEHGFTIKGNAEARRRGEALYAATGKPVEKRNKDDRRDIETYFLVSGKGYWHPGNLEELRRAFRGNALARRDRKRSAAAAGAKGARGNPRKNPQQSFNPINYFFEWTPDWYTWDREAAMKAARLDRDLAAKRLQAQGYPVKKWSNSGQLMRRGGIGSGHPEIDEIVTVYMLDTR